MLADVLSVVELDLRLVVLCIDVSYVGDGREWAQCWMTFQWQSSG